MKTKEFLKQHSACKDGAKWALSMSDDMAAVWEEMIRQEKYDWLLWTIARPGVFTDSVLRGLACRFVRETPLPDGRTVWDLLTDERSRNAIEVAEQYEVGKATYEELKAAYAAASAAAYAYAVAADAAAYATARAAYAAYAANAAHAADVAYATDSAAYAYAVAYNAAAYVAYAAAQTAQIRMISELGNPFRKGLES